MDRIFSLSVLDGRYRHLTEPLRDVFSEYGLMHQRVVVEVKWLTFLARELNCFQLDASEVSHIEAIGLEFNQGSAERIKEIESTTNHDVKAVEYYIKERLEAAGLSGGGEGYQSIFLFCFGAMALATLVYLFTRESGILSRSIGSTTG